MANSDILAEALSYLKELPSESPLWQSDIPDFLASFAEIADQKAKQRESARNELEAFIKAFVEENSERLDWLGVERNAWNALDRVSIELLSEVKGGFENLRGLIEEYDSIPSEAPSMAETETLFVKTADIFRRMRQVKSSIDAILVDNDAGSRGEGKEPNEQPPVATAVEGPIEIKLSNDATLSELSLSEGAVDISQDKFSYDIDFASDAQFLELQPLLSNEGGVIQVSAKGKNEDFQDVLPVEGLYRISVAETGKTIVSIRVVAEDGEAERNYTLIIERMLSRDTTLSGIRVSKGEVEVGDSSNEYRLELENQVDQLTVSPLTNDSKAIIRMNVHFPSGDTDEPEPSANGEFEAIALPVGHTKISLIVTAQDPTASDTYVLDVARRASNDTSLRSLEVVGAVLDFEPSKVEYAVEFVDESESMMIVTEASHSSANVEATVEVNGGSVVHAAESEPGVYEVTGLGLGNSIVRILVTAEDGTSTQTYMVDVTRRADKRTKVVDQIWSLMARDDISGAYWLARALETQGMTPPVQPELLLAVQGAIWLTPDTDTYVDDLSAVVFNVSPKEDNDIEILLGLSAALNASIQAPGTNLSNWLASPKTLPVIDTVVSEIFNFTTALGGRQLRQEFITGDRGFQRLQSRIAEASSSASNWLEESKQHRHKLQRANNVWQYISSEGNLGEILTHVVKDERSRLEAVRDHLAFLESESNVVDSINQADRSLMGSAVPRREITGAARRWLIRRVQEAASRAAVWCELVVRETDVTSHREDERWLVDQVSTLRKEIDANCPAVLEALDELSSDANPPGIAAAALCAGRSLRRLADYLNLRVDSSSQPRGSPAAKFLALINSDAEMKESITIESQSLEVAIARRLLWIPSIDLDESGLPVDVGVLVNSVLNGSEVDGDEESLEAVIQAQIDKGDFRFIVLLESGLASEAKHELAREYRTEINSAKDTLALHLEDIRAYVDQSSNDGVIEFEGERWDRFIGEIDDIDVSKVLNFKAVHDSLDRIKDSVDEERAQRRRELTEEWDSQCRAFEEAPFFDENFLKEVEGTFDRASQPDSMDIRVMEDCVSRLRNYGSDEPFRFGLELNSDNGLWLEDFSSFCGAISDPKAHARGSSGLKTLTRR